MIITVFVTTADERDQWRADLLEHSWLLSGQPGELVRLVACTADADLPMHSMARVVRTMPYSPHPYFLDEFDGYNTPAALLDWVVRERIDATLLILDLDSLFLSPVDDEIEHGAAIGNTWRDWPKGDGPFGLSADYRNLQAFCVNTKLKPPKVRMPVLIHSTDLKKMAARWLELTALIRCEVNGSDGKPEDAHEVAYTIAAAEYGVAHRALKLAVSCGDRKADRAMLIYRDPVHSAAGKAVWQAEDYVPWTEVDPSLARAGAGRKFLSRLLEYSSVQASGEHLGLRRPWRSQGVREARLPDRVVLEIPGAEKPLSLNMSAAAIWELCDNQRTLADIADALEQQFEVPRSVLCADIDQAILHLHTHGAIDLESTVHEQ